MACANLRHDEIGLPSLLSHQQEEPKNSGYDENNNGYDYARANEAIEYGNRLNMEAIQEMNRKAIEEQRKRDEIAYNQQVARAIEQRKRDKEEWEKNNAEKVKRGEKYPFDGLPINVPKPASLTMDNNWDDFMYH